MTGILSSFTQQIGNALNGQQVEETKLLPLGNKELWIGGHHQVYAVVIGRHSDSMLL